MGAVRVVSRLVPYPPSPSVDIPIKRSVTVGPVSVVVLDVSTRGVDSTWLGPVRLRVRNLTVGVLGGHFCVRGTSTTTCWLPKGHKLLSLVVAVVPRTVRLRGDFRVWSRAIFTPIPDP